MSKVNFKTQGPDLLAAFLLPREGNFLDQSTKKHVPPTLFGAEAFWMDQGQLWQIFFSELSSEQGTDVFFKQIWWERWFCCLCESVLCGERWRFPSPPEPRHLILSLPQEALSCSAAESPPFTQPRTSPICLRGRGLHHQQQSIIHNKAASVVIPDFFLQAPRPTASGHKPPDGSAKMIPVSTVVL